MASTDDLGTLTGYRLSPSEEREAWGTPVDGMPGAGPVGDVRVQRTRFDAVDGDSLVTVGDHKKRGHLQILGEVREHGRGSDT